MNKGERGRETEKNAEKRRKLTAEGSPMHVPENWPPC